jgi:DegV family protein with EDD domain
VGVAIVTDSTSDIDPDHAREIGVDVVPLFVIFGERSFRDYVELSRAEFYERLAGGALPSTSQPTAAMFEEVFTRCAATGDEIVCVLISQTLSGTINAASTAAARLSGARVAVVDSQSVAGGLRMQVEQATRLRDRGAGSEEIVAALHSDLEAQRLFAVAPDLSHLERTGRIGKAKAVLGTLLRIVPVLRLRAGTVEVEAQVRTFARAQEAMIEAALRAIGEYRYARLMVMHTNAPGLARQIADALGERLTEEPRSLQIVEAGPVIAAHAGPGAVGIFYMDDLAR